MKVIVTVRINIGIRRWQMVKVFLPNTIKYTESENFEELDEVYEWIHEHFRDKNLGGTISSSFQGYYPAMNKVPIMFRVINVKPV